MIKSGLVLAQTNAESERSLSINARVVTSERSALGEAFSSPEPKILLVCARDRDLWQGPKQEVHESQNSGFCAEP